LTVEEVTGAETADAQHGEPSEDDRQDGRNHPSSATHGRLSLGGIRLRLNALPWLLHVCDGRRQPDRRIGRFIHAALRLV
jgi:hypothetical protein